MRPERVPIEAIDELAHRRSAEDAVERLEKRIAGELPPKENLASNGPRNLPKPSAKKRRRRIAEATKRASRAKKPTRRQRALLTLPRSR
jgi:hypothetical protein